MRSRHEGFVIDFLADIPDLTHDGLPLKDGFADAAFMWTMQSPVTMNAIDEYKDPCDRTPNPVFITAIDNLNSIDMTPEMCGEGPFVNALAIAFPGIAEGIILESDILFSNEFTWGIYDGPIRVKEPTNPNDPLVRVDDIRRTALHEIGHSLGLDHSIFFPSAMAIKNPDFYELTADDVCGISILYEEPESCTLLLGESATASGAPTTAVFTGGSSPDEGMTYKSTFSPSESIDVMTTVVVDVNHATLRGNIHVIAVLPDGSLMGMNEAGGFESFGATLPSADSKVLASANELFILKDFILADFGVPGLTVLFYVGYSVASAPGEVHYGTEPITLVIE